MEIQHLLESILFVSSKPLSSKDLAKYTGVSIDEVAQALTSLQSARANSGIVLLSAADKWQLATNADYSEPVKAFLNTDLREQLTEATAEVLTIIAYRKSISKPEIEAIRGVNSQYSIRQLLMRGLIERVTNPSDTRTFNYQVTTDFLSSLGVQKVEDLPDFSEFIEKIKLPTKKAEDSDSKKPEAPSLDEQIMQNNAQAVPAIIASSTETFQEPNTTPDPLRPEITTLPASESAGDAPTASNTPTLEQNQNPPV